jgi:hypothetical protein
MSYLSRPRIAFFADDAAVSPSTANNVYIVNSLDYDCAELRNPPAIEGAALPKMSDAAYREWMTTLITYSDPLDQIPDPTQPDWQPAMPGSWNYWGDHLVTFGSAKTTSAWLEDAPATDDPLVGAAVAFNGRMADLNPADTFCTQLVGAGFSVIGPDADGAPAELLRGIPTTAFTRWFNLFRLYGGGSFQAVIPNASLAFIDAARAPDSPGLRALRAGAAEGGGLLLRWCFYGMQPELTMLEMYDRFERGEQAQNPKIGRVVGSIGVWNGRDLTSVPVGRILRRPAHEQVEALQQQIKSHEDVERVATPGTLLNAQNAEIACEHNMGPAAAVVEDGRVLLDLGTAFPEAGCDKDYTGDPVAKHDFGAVALEVAYGDSSAALGPVRYDRETYERLGGVWEVPFDPGSEVGRQLADGLLQLRDEAGIVLLRESEAVQVVTDDQAVYLDLAETPGGVRALGSASLRVFAKGEPIAEAVTLTVERWTDYQKPGKANSVNPLVVTATEIDERRDGAFELEVPAGGRVDVPIEAGEPGCYKLRYVAPGDEGSAANWAVDDFSCFRVLPFKDYSDVPDEQLTFEFVYGEVFSYYAILYPVMSRFIPWSPDDVPLDEERIAQFATLIRYVIDEARVGTALAMPITRELPAGKRALLKRWCDLQAGYQPR